VAATGNLLTRDYHQARAGCAEERSASPEDITIHDACASPAHPTG